MTPAFELVDKNKVLRTIRDVAHRRRCVDGTVAACVTLLSAGIAI